MSALGCSDLVHEYPGGVRALGDGRGGVDLEAGPGELVCVIGPNGSGKSTLIKCLAGQLEPTSGRVFLGDRPLTELDARERARRIAVVPQFLPALHDISARDFVLGGRYAHFGRWAGPSADDRGLVRCALEAADVLDLAERSMSALSGGQRQRVLVARAIAQESALMLVDEPTNSLDPEHQLQVFELIARSVSDPASGGRTALVVTHELNLAAQFATRVVLLDAVCIVADGPTFEVLREPVLQPVYGNSLRFGTLAEADGTERPFVLPWRARPGPD